MSGVGAVRYARPESSRLWGDPEDPSKRLVRVTWSGGPHQEVLGDLSTFDGGIPSSVLVHPLQSQTLYVGTAKGDLFRSDDREAT